MKEECLYNLYLLGKILEYSNFVAVLKYNQSLSQINYLFNLVMGW